MRDAAKVTKCQINSKTQQGKKDKGQTPISNFKARNKKYSQNIQFL